MAQFNAYLIFDGTCAEAFGFYEKTFGGKTRVMTFDQLPPGEMKVPPGAEKRVMHAFLSLDDGSVLMASDCPPGQPYKGIHGVSISLSYKDKEEARKMFAALAEGGKIDMPIDKTLWVELFGMVTDRFGVAWMVNGGEHMSGGG